MNAPAPTELPTEEMLNAARDWSRDKYGKPIGNDAAIGCWNAMQAAAPRCEVRNESVRTATLWFEQQIENAKQDQISGFRSGPQVRGERAHARHCALYEAQQVFLEAVSTPDVAQAPAKPLRWARPLGATMDSMRKHVWETGLASLGDTILVWINEGDFWQLMLNGCELKEYKNPDSPPVPSAQCAIPVCTCRPGPCQFPSAERNSHD